MYLRLGTGPLVRRWARKGERVLRSSPCPRNNAGLLRVPFFRPTTCDRLHQIPHMTPSNLTPSEDQAGEQRLSNCGPRYPGRFRQGSSATTRYFLTPTEPLV